ncbi:4Fe-4S binding protein [bacterium]|nr:4Fe-4S binding protein [bacterium]MCI0607426.1 4Fe-4S binding protein [bacterium]
MTPLQIRPPEAAAEHNKERSFLQRAGLTTFATGMFLFLVAATGVSKGRPLLFLLLSVGLTCTGALVYFLALAKEAPPGIKNNHIFSNAVTYRGWNAWILGVFLTLFYIALYWFPKWIENWVRITDPLSLLITGKPADRWFMYGAFYTVAVLVMGARMILVKYRHNRYQIIRTLSVMFFQLGFAFLIPNLLHSLNQPDFYFSYFWPLKYDYLFPKTAHSLLSHPGGLGFFMLFWGAAMTFIGTPIFTYFFGKRWYCSWVCGCGGLAETLGDPYRHLSDKSLKAWNIERWLIHSVLVTITIVTALLWINSLYEGAIFGKFSGAAAKAYGFYIGAIFSGVIGVGFYPLMGARVWCRFGCPMAAILGIIQKFFSRFRITTNGGQCISCGNCSTYCEQGIDVRWYAQRGQNIIRASCVGCGICAAVCPRGVLKLENAPSETRYNFDKID